MVQESYSYRKLTRRYRAFSTLRVSLNASLLMISINMF